MDSALVLGGERSGSSPLACVCCEGERVIPPPAEAVRVVCGIVEAQPALDDPAQAWGPCEAKGVWYEGRTETVHGRFAIAGMEREGVIALVIALRPRCCVTVAR